MPDATQRLHCDVSARRLRIVFARRPHYACFRRNIGDSRVPFVRGCVHGVCGVCNIVVFYLLYLLTFCLTCQGIFDCGRTVCNVQAIPEALEDIADLGVDFLYPSTQVPVEADVEHVVGFPDSQSLLSPGVVAGRRRPRGRACGTRSLSGPSASQCSLPHKVRGPNWIEAEMLVLIG